MKKILLILCMMFLLVGCKEKNPYLELGYSEGDLALIETLNEEHQNLILEKYDEELLKLISFDDFREDNFEEYLKFKNDFDYDELFYFVNNNIVTKDNISKIKELYNSDYFIKKNEELYLKYLEEYESVRDVLEIVNTKRYKELYSDIEETDLSKNYLMLVNKYYALPDDYEPEDLVAIDGGGYLRQEVYEHYKDLADDAYNEGYNLVVVSAYRSYWTQYYLYNRYCQSDPVEVVDTYSARPGHSEHQTGLCIDVSLPGVSLDDFYLYEASDWLKENAYKYGFIIRYTAEKENITGYESEPWQIRYVGDVAKDIYERNITLDEYYAVFLED